MEQSVESNFFQKFKTTASLPILDPVSDFFFKKKKKDFSENPVNLDMRKSSSNYFNCSS